MSDQRRRSFCTLSDGKRDNNNHLSYDDVNYLLINFRRRNCINVCGNILRSPSFVKLTINIYNPL